ncbi:MAG: HIRAN domain-containing protein [Methanobrevibacter sp.]|nr:HIRAN domain-containing protein [Methanobrevibacter sp.]
MSNIQKPDNKLTDFVNFIHKKGKIKSFSQDIRLITLNVAGLYYADNIDEIFPKIKVGDKLELFRESSNEYDHRAILVKYNGEKIGYVPRKDNHVLSNLMDGGKQLYGVVESIGVDELYGDDSVKFLRFKIFLNEEF